MLEKLTFRRSDGTFVAIVNGLPYHVVEGDMLWPEAQAIALQMGNALPFEPPPAPPPPAPAPAPQEVSVWQFMTAAWQMGFITQAEALAAVKEKVIPPVFAEALVDLPAQTQAAVQLKFAGITKMVRADPLFTMIVAANKATDAQLDAVFMLADGIT